MVTAMASDAGNEISKADYLTYIKNARDLAVQQYNEELERWKKTPQNLRDKNVPQKNVSLGIIDALLYSVTGDRQYAESAREILVATGERVYQYVRAIRQIESSGVLSEEDWKQMKTIIAEGANSICIYEGLEWGAMNHATNGIVDGLPVAAKIMPDHPDSAKWLGVARNMLDTSWGKWSIEDSQNYLPIWFRPLVNYADFSGRVREFFDMPTTRYCFEYFVNLLCPAGQIVEFGDGSWGGAWSLYIALLERGATEYRNPNMKFAAHRIFEANRESISYISNAAMLVDAYLWADDTVKEEAPTTKSELVLEDLFGKKVAFRSGWGKDDTFLLLNYRDVGNFGLDGKEHLRATIPVDSEKTHHGHADENAICLLMSKGSVLLDESGYRETHTMGPHGEFRADTFHNRLVAREGKAPENALLFPFLLDDGVHRRVETALIHFRTFRDVDISRTRLIDRDRGYQWDRILVYLKDAAPVWKDDLFIIFDGVKILKDGEFTFTDLLYTDEILAAGEKWYDTRASHPPTNYSAGYPARSNASLVVYFPDLAGKRHGAEEIRRSYRNQACMYQSQSGDFASGDFLAFTTVLIPRRNEQEFERPVSQITLVEVEPKLKGLAVRIGDRTVCVRLDLEMEHLKENVRPRYAFESGKVRYGPFETDARFAYFNSMEKTIDYAFIEATKILYEGKELFAAPKFDFPWQPNGQYTRSGVPKWRDWQGTSER
jgi:hypothetical protein